MGNCNTILSAYSVALAHRNVFIGDPWALLSMLLITRLLRVLGIHGTSWCIALILVGNKTVPRQKYSRRFPDRFEDIFRRQFLDSFVLCQIPLIVDKWFTKNCMDK